MPPTLKQLVGHIAFGACVHLWVRALHFFVPTVTFKLFEIWTQIWTLNFRYCDSWITIIAGSFKLSQLIEDDECNMWCSFEKQLFYIFEVIAFREKHFVGGIMFHKHYF